MNKHYIRPHEWGENYDPQPRKDRGEHFYVPRKSPRRFAFIMFLGMMFLALVLDGIQSALGATINVSWTNPDKNTDGTPLTDLASIYLEWGSCSVFNEIATVQSNLTIATNRPGVDMAASITSNGLSKVCIHACAYTTAKVRSLWSNTVAKDLLPTLGKPVTLGQPVILKFNQE